jgi:hypothetical protein
VKIEVVAIVRFSVEEIPGPAMVLSDGEAHQAPPVRVATVDEVEALRGGTWDDHQRILKEFKKLGPLQFITELPAGPHRGQVTVVFETF